VTRRPVTLALCGDLMIGRGLDQVLPDPCTPELYEQYVTDANDYVVLAERESGDIDRPVPLAYPWGDARLALDAARPSAWIVNLETAVTRRGRPWPHKGIHYRVSPENARMLVAGGVDCCALANNHVLDWGRDGLRDTIATLDQLGLRHAGAGSDADAAMAPAAIDVGGGARVLVLSLAATTSGVPEQWRASREQSGVALLRDLSADERARVAERVRSHRRDGDLVVVSIHWGGNWGFDVSAHQRAFARGLVEDGAADVVHGHSSHHVKGIEVHRGRPILYGCGDLLNDYEGIGGFEAFRAELGLLYLVALDRDEGGLTGLRMVPTRVRRLQVRRAGPSDVEWLQSTMRRECARFGGTVRTASDGCLQLDWDVPSTPST
jgi:poly-gamma-glutamate synthesis protein (capsule biosynthesis protein)